MKIYADPTAITRLAADPEGAALAGSLVDSVDDGRIDPSSLADVVAYLGQDDVLVVDGITAGIGYVGVYDLAATIAVDGALVFIDLSANIGWNRNMSMQQMQLHAIGNSRSTRTWLPEFEGSDTRAVFAALADGVVSILNDELEAVIDTITALHPATAEADQSDLPPVVTVRQGIAEVIQGEVKVLNLDALDSDLPDRAVADDVEELRKQADAALGTEQARRLVPEIGHWLRTARDLVDVTATASSVTRSHGSGLDWCEQLFPGGGLAIPEDSEWERAERVLRETLAAYGEPSTSEQLRRGRVDGQGWRLGNRAFLRSQLRRRIGRDLPVTTTAS